MTKLSVEELVRAVVARSTRGRSPEQISDTATLGDLGYDDADAQELRLRLVKATSSARSTASKLERVLPITPDSTVRGVVKGLQRILPARAAKATSGRDLGDPRHREAETAVIVALSEVSPNLDFSQIALEMKLGKDLGLDAAAIAEAKIGVFKTLRNEGFSGSFSTIQVSLSSTVEAMVDQIHGVLSANVATGRGGFASSLPGDPTTGRKGNKETGVIVSGAVPSGRKKKRFNGKKTIRPPASGAYEPGLEVDNDLDDPPVIPGDIALAGDTTTGKKGGPAI